MSEPNALRQLSLSVAKVAPFPATRDRPHLLTPERAPFDGTSSDPTAAYPVAAAGGVEEAHVIAALARGRAEKRKPPTGGAFIQLVEPAPPELEAVTRAELVAQCEGTLSMLVRHRAERPLQELADNERQLFAQLDALAISGGDVVRTLVHLWRENEGDPWKTQATALALACMDGLDVLEAIFREIEQLPAEADALVTPLGEALALAPHPNVADLARDLLASPHPIARAIAMDALARRGPMSLEELRPHLADPHAAVVAAAIRAAAWLAPASGVPVLSPFVGRPQMQVAWAAARQLLVWGRPEPYFEVRSGRAPGLGPYALEVLIQAGAFEDLELFERRMTMFPPSPAQLSAVARFGAPSAWALLSHHLGNDDLADAAARALATLFGDRVPPGDTKKPAAWRAALAKGRFDASVRVRRGEPWRPRIVAEELLRGDMPRGEARARVDELMARTGARVDAELWRWAPDAWPGLQLSCQAFEKADAHYPPGTWTTRAR